MLVYVKKSTIPGAGKGLFAKTAIRRGSRLKISGVLIRKKSLADQCTAFADPYKFRVGAYLLIPLGYAGMVNHSVTPNLKKVIQGKTVYLEALRPIRTGEELCFCYSRYAQNKFI